MVRIMYYINCFFIYSIIGHILETVFYTIVSGESGILYGLWTPIYGVGCILVLFIYEKFIDKLKIKRWIKNILIFLTGFILLSGLEYLAGILVEYFFNTVFWSYENLKFHIGKYIALELAFVWGIASLGLIYIINPVVDYFEKKIPSFITWIFILLFIIDCLSTVYFKVL